MLLIEFLQPLHSFSYAQFVFEVSSLKSAKYSSVFKSEKFEICELMAGNYKANRFFKAIIDSVSKTAPKLFHICPYYGSTSIYNLSLGNAFLRLIPVGSYKISVIADIVETGKAKLYLSGGIKIIQ